MDINILPIDTQRIIFRYISSDSSNVIRHAIKTDKFKLKYVRIYVFRSMNAGNMKIWEELKPSSIKKIYYGDHNRLYRTKISKGEKIRLKTLNISF
jgi:hypothetical protein